MLGSTAGAQVKRMPPLATFGRWGDLSAKMGVLKRDAFRARGGLVESATAAGYGGKHSVRNTQPRNHRAKIEPTVTIWGYDWG